TPPSSASCAPSTLCGSDPSSITSSNRRGLLYQPLYPRHGNPNPLGSVVELVAKLVDRLLELEDGEQPVDRDAARRQQRRVHGVEEPLAGLLLPALRRGRRPLELRGDRGVGERAQHPRDVAERRALPAPVDD